MRRLASIFTAVIALALSLGGCAGSAQPEVTAPSEVPPAEEITGISPTATPGSGMGAQSFSYLEGLWTVTAAQGESDSAAPADPSGTWEFSVMGESMTVYIGERRYEGLLSEAESGWSYYGMVTGANTQGELLGGYVEIDATDLGDGMFTGALVQSVDADDATPAYAARWTIEATRQ
ncbi:MAG: hypothetical protein ACYCXR_02310 [Coriobacteriia bacterium]